MKPIVAHFIRKYSQLKASFIKNQLESHINFKPVVIYKIDSHKRVGGFADFEGADLPGLCLSNNFSLIEKLKFKGFRLISKRDVMLINDFLQHYDAKVLHFHYGTDAGIYQPFLKKNNIPSVVSFYGYDCSGFPNYLGGYGKLFLKSRVFPYITRVLAMSDDMKNDLIKIGCDESKIIVHHHGNEVDKFGTDRNYKNEENKIRFLIISGLTPQKGHLFLLDAFKEALKIRPNIHLTIVGDGILRERIVNQIQNNQLDQHVNFDKSVVYGSERHLEYLKSHDVFIHPSVTDKNGDKEGIPGAIIEAMSSGLPVISTYHAGIPSVIQNETSGILVKEWDSNSLIDAMIRLTDNYKLREKIGRAGQAFALKNLKLSDKEEELEKIYSQLI